MKERNQAFFGLFENTFKTLRKHYGEEIAIKLFREIMETGLGNAYGSDFDKGHPSEFARIVGERDEAVGLRVEFPEVSDDKIIYRFYDDPFPGLNGIVESRKLDATYIPFKISYLLGDEWTYKTTQHLWDGVGYTEHVITKK